MRSLLSLLATTFLTLPALVHSQNQVISQSTVSLTYASHPFTTTPIGSVVGTYVQNNTVAAFYGVRYAAPPVGSLRWRSPQAVSGWSDAGVLNGTAPPPACLSVDSVTYPTAEDCLSVDVWTPANFNSTSNYPIIINMVGGGYVRQAAQPGDSLVATSQQVVYVYVRYRVNVTGFLSTKSLSMESTGSVMASGNYGLQDQQLALKWLQQNARSFGGDPNRVTIFGHSASSWSMCFHLVMPGSAGLFHQMIGEAGGCDQSVITSSLEDNEAQGEKFAAALNCSTKQMDGNYTAQNQCMRSYMASTTAVQVEQQKINAVSPPLALQLKTAFRIASSRVKSKRVGSSTFTVTNTNVGCSYEYSYGD